jgi:hypothetical protein
MSAVTIPRYAPITNMVLKYDPEHIPSTDTWLGKFATIPNGPDVNFGPEQSYTIEVWVKPALVQKWNVTTQVSILEKGGTSESPSIQYAIRYLTSPDLNAGSVLILRSKIDVTPIIITGITASITSDAKINDGRFHYVVFVRDAEKAQLQLYLDGLAGPPVDDPILVETASSPVLVGRSGDDSSQGFFAGEIGQVRMWNKALPANSIQQIYASAYPVRGGHRDGNSLLAEGLVGDWRFNEGYGGRLAFDYAKSNNVVLGGGVEANSPEWVVSTILRQPTFIVDQLPSKKQAVIRPEETTSFSRLTLNELLLRARAVVPHVEAPSETAPVEEAAPPPETEALPKVKVKSGAAKVRAKTKATKTSARTKRRAKR